MTTTDFSEFHDELRTVARSLLSRYSPLQTGGRETEPVPWAQIAESGWAGLEVPEDANGAGATFAEVAVLLREMGRAVTDCSVLGTAVLGVGLLNRLEPAQGVSDLLAQVASGESRVAVAWPIGEEELEARPSGFRLDDLSGTARLHGSRDLVLDAGEADTLLVPIFAEDGQGSVVAVGRGAAGLDIQPIPLVDETRRVAAVSADGVEVAAAAHWPFAGHAAPLAREVTDRGALAVACDSIGLAEAMLETTVAYTVVRQQFGRPIGSFQAVKHACADMLVQIRIGSELIGSAVEAVAAGDPDAWIAVSMAKSFVTEAGVAVAGKAMQLHGGVGYTWERGIHAYLKRAILNRSLFGAPAAHRRRLASRYLGGVPLGS